MRPHFTLTVVTSADGLIARGPGDTPQSWASPEEQALFSADVKAADWAVMGRGTHEAADRPDRRRIVFSSAGGPGAWRRPTQLWLDPARLAPQDLATAVETVWPFRRGVVLGGTRVHDWFRDHDAIDRVHLTVEPVSFGTGLAIFGDQVAADPVEAFRAAGYTPLSEIRLNAGGTRFVILEPDAPAGRHRP